MKYNAVMRPTITVQVLTGKFKNFSSETLASAAAW